MDTVEYYNRNAQRFFQDTVDIDMASRYEPFLERIPPGGAILDAGCGSGRDSRAFRNRGYQVTAFDASPELVRLAHELTGLPVAVMRFQEMDYDAKFDGIWACASLLHVPRAELAPVFSRFEAALKPGGHWHASFKYGEGETVKGDRVFSNFTEETFRDLLVSFPALEVVDIQVTADLRPTRQGEYWLNAIVRKRMDSA